MMLLAIGWHGNPGIPVVADADNSAGIMSDVESSSDGSLRDHLGEVAGGLYFLGKEEDGVATRCGNDQAAELDIGGAAIERQSPGFGRRSSKKSPIGGPCQVVGVALECVPV